MVEQLRLHILVVGGSGGIGFAVVKHLLSELSRFDFLDVHVDATFHSQQPELENSRLNWHKVDATKEADIKRLSSEFEQLDWLINCVGMLHTPDLGPEKNLASIDPEFFLKNISVNTLPSLLLAKYFTPVLKTSDNPKFAVVSAKVGSISDNRLGGWYSYRSSKAALNMFIKTMSIEWQRTIKKGTVLALHPGTTDTALSKPFQTNVPEGKLFESSYVAHQLVDIIRTATPKQSGHFFAYDGEQLTW
ncbi:putative C factor cell-cell signaling protein [Vibrio crassostreae]|uniref:Putative C factor cell-cell signaling protein n=1 Tax=Vibrio crassostreae TaxID=246167 RepID=A0A822MU66_9VIBR|nr:SDR family oxidoreductase [Vibrio crassostreae]MDH5950236.1 SDR family oxidoreductase [Vibrio crassostreae]RPF18629.1 NAD(P)-dependent dehydrogenase (short-subunit alcohol dehydrogenase family) [Vibrio crassostreae]TCN06655.1 NAD(P)-dependent dehydrogenase (short-subunit alcohol dehydrogenase family) [Vibrio crassostreae]TCN90043.1 NAD(P)-dependent dehydrogenase (short-subunit alcohol dehydrogenase family) [Vibrio crassostreae]TCU06116.1 NAD(P)-dependent dehydrogenase (short-subunit alcohol